MIIIMEEIKKICPHDLYEIGLSSLSVLLNHEYSKYKYGISLEWITSGKYQKKKLIRK